MTSCCGSSLSIARPHLNKQYVPPGSIQYGLSSADMMFPVGNVGFLPSGYGPYGGNGIACNPCRNPCSPFDDTIIDEPDFAYRDALMGNYSFVTTNFNQTRDLRGDLPVGLGGAIPVSLSSQAAFFNPYGGICGGGYDYCNFNWQKFDPCTGQTACNMNTCAYPGGLLGNYQQSPTIAYY